MSQLIRWVDFWLSKFCLQGGGIKSCCFTETLIEENRLLVVHLISVCLFSACTPVHERDHKFLVRCSSNVEEFVQYLFSGSLTFVQFLFGVVQYLSSSCARVHKRAHNFLFSVLPMFV
jgi:hypothetical protein